MRSSGTTAISTVDDTVVTLLGSAASGSDVEVNVVNTGTVEGFISIDGGTTWVYMPPGATGAPASRTFNLRHAPINAKVQAKRIGSGSNMTGLYADAY